MHDIVVVKVLEPMHKLYHVKLDLFLLEAAVWRMLENQGEFAPAHERHDKVEPIGCVIEILHPCQKGVIGRLEHL